MLNGKKNVLLAVTGSIAAYKAADIARGFIKKCSRRTAQSSSRR